MPRENRLASYRNRMPTNTPFYCPIHIASANAHFRSRSNYFSPSLSVRVTTHDPKSISDAIARRKPDFGLADQDFPLALLARALHFLFSRKTRVRNARAC